MLYKSCFLDGLETNEYRYEKAFVDYFEDELVRCNYDWKEVVTEYLFSGEEPIFNCIVADRTFSPTVTWKRNQADRHSWPPTDSSRLCL